jgi:23S rRNA pseudouridine1911/1915/1917 synthase
VARQPSLIEVGKNRWEPGLVHRLDRDTSGLVVVAKDQSCFENLRAQFRRRQVRKGYKALVWGRTPDRAVISYPLAHDPKDKRKMIVNGGRIKGGPRLKGWKAVTRFQTLGRSKDFSVVGVEIFTGVTHQVRAHLEAAGYPIVGDPLYRGNLPMVPCFLGRQFLHACRLEFAHPRNGRLVNFESPLPAQLGSILDRLGMRGVRQLCP